jgi:hypothetical protein
MKLSTTYIAALATSTFLVAVSAQSACDSIADVTDGFGAAADVLGLISNLFAPLQVFSSVPGVVANAACAAEKILTEEDVGRKIRCGIRKSDYKRLTNGVDSLADLISANKLPGPTDFENYATEAQALEADGKSTGYQASLLNVDMAVIKVAMYKSKSLLFTDGDEVIDAEAYNNARGQAVAGIDTSLEYMLDLEKDLTDFYNDRSNRQVEKERTCIGTVPVPCGDVERPNCTRNVCAEWRWDLKITYCEETYTYSKKINKKVDLSQEYINARIQETKRKLKNKFFPAEYRDVKNKLKDERDSLYDSLMEVDFKFESDLVISEDEEEKKNKSFDAEL